VREAERLGRADAIHERRLALLIELSPDIWVRPMDLGGSSGSYHGGDLAYLARRRLVERRPRASWYSRPSWLYRRTLAGTNYLYPMEEPAQNTPCPAMEAAWKKSDRERNECLGPNTHR